MHREVSSDIPSLEPASKATSTFTPASTATTEDPYAATTPTQSNQTAVTAAAKAAGPGGTQFNPPQSRPLLEGGSGFGGGGMEMTAIQEERETGA